MKKIGKEICMNKKWVPHIIVLMGIITFVVVEMSCVTMSTNNSAVYTEFQDKTVSWQEQAVIFFYSEDGYLYRLEVDGKKGGTRPPHLRVIPAGTHTLNVGFSDNNNMGGFKREFTFDFQSGKRYVLVATVAHIEGLLSSIGKNSLNLVPLDEFRPVWEKLNALRANRTAERNDADYKKMVLDHFTIAENALNAN